MLNKSIYVELRDFGRNMQYLGIFMLLSLIPGIGAIAMILYLVFMFNALKNIKLMYYSLNDQNLESFRIKIISSITRGFLSVFSLVPGGIFLAIGLHLSMWNNDILIIIGSLLLLLGFILMISSFATERTAWKNLKAFLRENQSELPDFILREVIEGTDNLETGALLYSMFMFGITIIIGFIMRVIGYFKLAKLSQVNFPDQVPVPVEPIVQIVQSSPKVSNVSLERSENTNFCPMCGSKISRYGIYCSECGSKLQ
ncbi:MAG: zinc ribbon domain-containing protein [Promethearchaeota archaeon]|nr:MAG: zinc ribbon domain-containing protein [Candidatus Lokiarchaeota archaeon]